MTEVHIHHLTILPPRQSGSDTSSYEGVALPPLRAEEAVASLRGALSEIVGFAHLTKFRFVLEPIDDAAKSSHGGSTSSANGDRPLISPYTLKNCLVTVPPSIQTLHTDHDVDSTELTLDEYGDLSSLVQVLEQESEQEGRIVLTAQKYGVRVVLERYDGSAIREQIGRVRAILGGNAPALTSLLEDGAADEVKDGEAVAGKVKDDDKTETVEKKAKTDAKTEMKAETKKDQPSPAQQPPHFPPGYDLSLSTALHTDLSTFYHLACGEERLLFDDAEGVKSKKVVEDWMEGDDGKKKKRKKKKNNGGNNNSSNGNGSHNDTPSPSTPSMHETEQILHHLNSQTIIEATVRLSGYHPPPSHRRILGDLAYIECLLPNTPPIHITAIPLGFYLNNSTETTFDPTPATNSCYSHSLLDCLLQASPNLYQSYSLALVASRKRMELLKLIQEDAYAQLVRPVVSNQWNNYSGMALGNGVSTLAPRTFVPRVDGVTLRPSWLLSLPTANGGTSKKQLQSQNHSEMHQWDMGRCQDDMTSLYGMDVKGGGIRDWNEELQSARDMSVDALDERLERARLVVLLYELCLFSRN